MDREELRSAYLDGELSVTEAIEYEKSLTEQERAGLVSVLDADLADLKQARSLEHFRGHHHADIGRNRHRREGAD